VRFNDSTIHASFEYLKNPTESNLERLTATPGAQTAYKHNHWASGETINIKTFWKNILDQVTWSEQLETRIINLEHHLTSQPRDKWLNPVLEYLPESHIFNRTTVYLIIGYDHIVYKENVTINLNANPFHVDKRETIYYLIHELAHAGYFKYHKMPNLTKPKTPTELANTVKLLTQLEGMGVISPLKLRLRENGLTDNDYQTLLNKTETNKRVTEYFQLLSTLENQAQQKPETSNLKILDQMSRQPKRLWYITGCHMAQTIEKTYGTKTLKNLVKQGPKPFFQKYKTITRPMPIKNSEP
jgi:hypothetical protein